MEFGYFAQVFVPDKVAETTPGYEQRRLLDNLELSIRAEEFGFKYVWASEHHFLREYSHMSAPEVFLASVASRTERIHLGSAIFNITAQSLVFSYSQRESLRAGQASFDERTDHGFRWRGGMDIHRHV